MTTQSQDSTDDEIKSQVLPNWFCGGKPLSRALNTAQSRFSRIFKLHIWPDVSGASIPALSPHLSKRNGASSGTGLSAERGFQRNGASSGTGQVLVAHRISQVALYSAAQMYPAVQNERLVFGHPEIPILRQAANLAER